MVDGPMNFIIFYLTFFLMVAFIGGLVPSTGLGVTGGDVSALPVLDDANLTLISYLIFGFELIVYFLGLQGLAIVGIPAIYSAMLGIILNVVMLYVVVRLARGGG